MLIMVATPSASPTLATIESYKGKAPMQHSSRSNVGIAYSKEGDKHAHQTNIGAVDFALHNCYIA